MPRAVVQARAWVTERAAGLGLPAAQRARLSVLSAAVVLTALQAAPSSGSTIDLGLLLRRGVVRLTASTSSGWPRHSPSISVLDRLSDGWSLEPDQSTLWCEVDAGSVSGRS